MSIDYQTLLEENQDTMVAFGARCGAQLTQFFLQERVRSLLIFCGGKSSAVISPFMEELQDDFLKLSLMTMSFPGIPPEPDADVVRKMTQEILKHNPDMIAAVGGGSVMDAAKAALLSAETGMDVAELFGVNVASTKFPEKKFRRVVCLPTTAGTGSEVTPYSNVVDPETKVKKLIMEKAIIPSCAIVAPEFCVTMPPALTLTTALDAMVHCVESLLNTKAANAPAESTNWGQTAIRLIVKNLPAALKDGNDLAARTALSAAATLGGMCIKCRPTSLPHLGSFSLYGKTSHGLAVAALLIPFWKYYLGDPAAAEATMSMAGIFSEQKENTPEEVVEHCHDFLVSVGGPGTLSALGCERSVIGKIAADALKNKMKLESCPRKIEFAEAEKIISGILEKAW